MGPFARPPSCTFEGEPLRDAQLIRSQLAADVPLQAREGSYCSLARGRRARAVQTSRRKRLHNHPVVWATVCAAGYLGPYAARVPVPVYVKAARIIDALAVTVALTAG
jgi:hypothetical protein